MNKGKPTRWAISDIHGCASTFKKLVKNGISLRKKDQLYLLGDYIDRGPNSKGVIDFILKLKKEGYHITCLLGNHEQMLLNARVSVTESKRWMMVGGIAALDSYGASSIDELPKKHLDFFQNLKHYVVLEDYILVHAGLNFDLPDPFIDKQSMIWIRNWHHRMNKDWLAGKIIVHGHTPIKKEQIKLQSKMYAIQQAIDIDNGCCFKYKKGMGQLCALNLDDQSLIFQPNIDSD